jgi:hypothetical protein
MRMGSGPLGNGEAACAGLRARDLHPVYGVAKPPRKL